MQWRIWEYRYRCSCIVVVGLPFSVTRQHRLPLIYFNYKMCLPLRDHANGCVAYILHKTIILQSKSQFEQLTNCSICIVNACCLFNTDALTSSGALTRDHAVFRYDMTVNSWEGDDVDAASSSFVRDPEPYVVAFRQKLVPRRIKSNQIKSSLFSHIRVIHWITSDVGLTEEIL